MAAEIQIYQRIPEPILQSNQIEVSTPRNERGERIGVGAILEKQNTQPGSQNESILQIALRSLLHYGRTTQEPPDAKERQTVRNVRLQLQEQQEASQVKQWAENHESGYSYTTDEEKASLAAKKQKTTTEQHKAI